MNTRRIIGSVVLVVWMCLVSMGASAQEKPFSPRWGIGTDSVVTIPNTAFSRVDSGAQGFEGGPGGRGAFCADSVTPCKAVGTFSLPTGAVIVGLDLEACDPVATGEAKIQLFFCPVDSGTCAGLVNTTVTSGFAGTPGCVTTSSAPLNITVQNAAAYYPLIATIDDDTAVVTFRAVRIRYRLQVSPAPATATFADVPTNAPQFRFVEALAAAGITAGCGGGNFCPDAPLTRGQMAVFLAAALGLHFPN